MKQNLREIPIKNYVILSVIILISLLIVMYFNTWFTLYNKEKNNTRILDDYLTVINYNEIDNYLVENPDSIIYVSIRNDDRVRNFERELKSSIKNNKISKKMLYMDITDQLNDKKISKELKNKYSLGYANILDVPNILVFEDGKLNFIYSISENGYNIKKVQLFLEKNDNLQGDDIID